MGLFVWIKSLISGRLRKLNYFLCCFFILFLLRLTTFGQDIHFSQYLSSPFNLNPALTGDFKGDYRLTSNYRNQWNAITVPYRTFGIGVDKTNLAGQRNLSSGLSVYSDEAGDSRMNTTIVQLAFSYGYPLSRDSSQSVYFGILPSLVRQQFDYSGLYFDNQYDNQTGLHDGNLPSGEAADKTALTYFNFNAGFRWNYTINSKNRLDAGIAIYNLVNTNKYYLSNEQSKQKRYNIHANYQVNVWKKTDLLPGILYTGQGESKSLVLGSSVRYLYNSFTAIHSGIWFRNQDAFFLSIGMTYQTLYMGFSYDINTSKLNQSSYGKGAYEISLIYVFRKFKPDRGKYLSCPNYL